MNKKNFFLIALLIVTLSSISVGQDVQGIDSLSNKGKKAFTFSINGLYLSGGLGGTYWINDNYALRVLLSGDYNSHQDLTQYDRNSYYGSASITAYLKRHFRASRNFSPYIGAGLGLTYSLTQDYAYIDGVHRSGTLTVPGLVGIEYWFNENISLAAEQIVQFRLDLDRYNRAYTISGSTSSLLLSVYF